MRTNKNNMTINFIPAVIVMILIITAFLCILYFNYKKVTEYPPDSFEKITGLDDGVVITGSMVIDILDKYKDSGIEFCVVTKEAETFYGTLRDFDEAIPCTYDKSTSETSPEYIVPMGSFETKVEIVDNKVISVIFTQR